ncbi:hypothetical protein C8R48DRAFT_670619 [Suillus tomentosus]|nr:hypothetical protein C8R48DRAFT_670619 [Suillus tomentosus]
MCKYDSVVCLSLESRLGKVREALTKVLNFLVDPIVLLTSDHLAIAAFLPAMVSIRPKNATQRPAKEIAVDTQRTREAQEARQLAAQNSINRVAEVEALMEIEQAGVIAKVTPVKPHPRPVVQKPRVTKDDPSKSRDALGTETSLQAKGGHTLKGVADDNTGTDGDCELPVESETKPKRKKKENLLLREAVSAVRLKKQNENSHRPDDLIKADWPGRSIDGKAHGPDKKGKHVNTKSKKFSLSGMSTIGSIMSNLIQRGNPQTPPPLLGLEQAMDPPSTPSKTKPKVTCSDDDGDSGDDDKGDSEERAVIVTEKGKGKAAMKTVIEIESGTDTEFHTAPIVVGNATSVKLIISSPQESDADNSDVLSLTSESSNIPFANLPYEKQVEIVSFALEQAPHTGKRKLEEVVCELGLDDLIDYEDEDDAMEFGDSLMELGDDTMDIDGEIEDASSTAKKGLKGTNSVGRTTVTTSVMAVEKLLVLQPAKKARSEPATQTLTTTTKVPRPAKRVKSEPTSKTSMKPAIPAVPESMLADMAIRPAAGNGQCQSSFWMIEAADLLCAVQATFNTMYPGVKYNIQPRGPIMGVITQWLCTWRSNFGFTAIALVANFLASLRESEDDEDEADDNEEDTDRKEKLMMEVAASLLKDYAFLFVDPDTCKASNIYHSVFVLQMIAMTHLNTVAGFIDVPELDTHALSLTKMEGVIAACAVALERALKLVAEKEKKSTDLKTPLKINKSTGKESNTPLAFSELNWGQFTTDYYSSIVKRGPKYTTDTIAMARQFVKDSGSEASMKGVSTHCSNISYYTMMYLHGISIISTLYYYAALLTLNYF